MNPSEQEPDAVNPIADQNTERLLAGAYRPETPDPAFLARVTAVMHAAAAECVESARPAPASRSRLPVKRWIGWVAAAGLLLALGAVGARCSWPAPVSSDRTEPSGSTARPTERRAPGVSLGASGKPLHRQRTRTA